ncbi:MAG: phosphatidylserine decarboxylase family protein [Deltaproteobacteria bacterium]|nr:phosphatidylserine decarboxylase family protein [Deltaproteobacteria bacterium]MBI4374198.1 phosphatidylserine decarboxylase family protein [Deltaproteobacteria bacterium]
MIAKEGSVFIAAALVISLALSVILGGYGVPALILPLYVAYFFRDPRRFIPTGKNLILSPADGRILSVDEQEEGRYLKRKMKKVSLFMSPFDVHINRIPCSGRIKQVFYNHGKYLAAFKEKASLDNEQNAVLMETDRGSEILFVQIAGWLARRIVCYLKGGEQVTRGERYGLIRFGSRIDLYLPLDVEILVSVGERAKGGETIIGRFLMKEAL